MSRPIFCGNFEYDARQNELERLFRKYGKVDRVDMKSGFAFIYMEDERDAEDAIHALDQAEFGRKGRRLRVEWTKQERGIRRPDGSGARKPSTNTRPSKTLFVINFDPYNTRTRDLERHFEQYGQIASVRIRRNFAFVQYETQEDATKALDATNMSKLMDRVISVEYAVRDDDRKVANSPDRNRDRSPDRRNYNRRRSPSPYRRDRGSPDYGRGSSRSPYKRERGSPDYGRSRSRSPRPYKRERYSPDNGRGVSRSPHQRERAVSDYGRGTSRSPPRRERTSHDNGRDSSRSPHRREKPSVDNGRGSSPCGTERLSPANGRSSRSRSPYSRGRASPINGRGETPKPAPEHKDSPAYGAGESPIRERYSSRSPAAEDGKL